MTVSLTVFRFDCEIHFNSTSINLYLTSFFSHFCNLATVASYCTWSIRLEMWKMCFVWSNSRLCKNHRKANATDANFKLFPLNRNISWEKMSCSGNHCSMTHSLHVYKSIEMWKIQPWNLPTLLLQWTVNLSSYLNSDSTVN